MKSYCLSAFQKFFFYKYSLELSEIMKSLNVTSVLSKAFRSGGQVLDAIGKKFELNPNIDRCKNENYVFM